MATLQEVFKSFCAFGVHATKPGAANAPALMDNSKFAKFFRDLKLLDKKVTSTDVDIIFNKIKPRTERKITFAQFKEGLKQMAEKKYPDDPEAVTKFHAKILEGKGPQTHGTTKAVKDAAVDRLTDASKYTGSHKERFDDSGKGKGVEGRKDIPDGAGYVSGYKEKDTYDDKVAKK